MQVAVHRFAGKPTLSRVPLVSMGCRFGGPSVRAGVLVAFWLLGEPVQFRLSPVHQSPHGLRAKVKAKPGGLE